jgi:hypothetical protein
MMFVTGMVVTLAVVWSIFYTTVLDKHQEYWIGWVVFIGALLLGVVVGFLFYKVAKIGAFFLAGWGGFTLGLLLYNSFFYLAFETVGLYCFCFALAIVFGTLAVFFFDHVIINMTALAGAYLFIEGIGMVAGRY